MLDPQTAGTRPPAGGRAAGDEGAPAGQAPAARDLARRVRASKALSATAKRQWLMVLPHLRPADRARLAAILRGQGGA
jgi:hypothetical protein